MNNYKIEISYDGSLFHGFQKQLNVRTVQSDIEDSLKLIIGDYELNYSGRTDAGVHARSQVLSLKTIENLRPSFFNSLDSLLGSEIKIKKYQKVKNSFHPRFDAKSRVYKYFLQPNNKGAPYNRDYRYLVKAPIELRQLKSIEKIHDILYSYPINTLPDHENLPHSTEHKKGMNPSHWVDMNVDYVKNIVKEGGIATLLLHPLCMFLEDEFYFMKKILSTISKYN